jgi:glycosyltransferase involved in cell wall biosynthesis
MDRTALIVSHSVLVSDPRIRRQIDWLTGDGWTVDTLGFGDVPDSKVRAHHVIGTPPVLLRNAPAKALVHLLLPPATQFRLLGESRIPRGLRRQARAGAYDLVVINELEFAPWVRDSAIFGAGGTRAHLDLHEYHPASAHPNDSLARRITARRSRWTRGLIAHPAFTSRSTVASGIADLYADELGIPPLSLVRNSPPYEVLEPRPVDPRDIRLLFHGMASRVRGLDEIVGAMRELPERFSMTFMLTPNQRIIEELTASIADLPRVRIVDPVPMRELAQRVNEYDLEIIFYPSRSLNYHFALPNKFFEAVQGRIGVVIGESPMMTELVRTHGNGIIVDGWSASDLARTLAGLQAADIDAVKQGAHRAAEELNARVEGAAFLRAVDGSD